MLDTISHPQVAHGTERFDRRINLRPRPSFGWGSLRRRKRLLGIGVGLCLAIAGLYVSFRPTTYTASSQLLVYIRQVLTGLDQAILPGRADLPMVQNQIELLRSGNVLAKVVETLQLAKDPEFTEGLRPPSEPQAGDPAQPSPTAAEDGSAFRKALEALNGKLSVRQIGTSHMVTVTFKASDPEKAARIVNSVIRIYLQERGRASDAASSKAPALREVFQSLGPSAQVVSEAEPPVKADGPEAVVILLAAALFGLGAAAAIAILLDVIDDTIRDAHQMECALGLECLGVVPGFTSIGVGSEDAAARRLLASENPVLRRAIAMTQDASSGRTQTIGVSSVVPGEGATTFAIGLALAAAASGKRVLLIDAVPENPSLSRWSASLLRLPPEARAEPETEPLAIVAKMQAGLHVLPLAERCGGGSRLLRRGLLDGVLNAAQAAYDLVIVDMPSLVEGPHVRAAAHSLDSFLLVVKWGATKSELVREAFRSSGEAQPKFIGTVINMAEEETTQIRGYELAVDMKAVTAS